MSNKDKQKKLNNLNQKNSRENKKDDKNQKNQEKQIPEQNKKVKDQLNNQQQNISQVSNKNEEEESMIYVFTKKFQKFEIRLSYLDDYAQGSALNRSIFKGFYNVALLLLVIILLNYPLRRYRTTGKWFNEELLNTFSRDFWLVVITWPMFYIWSYSAYFLQKFIIFGLPIKLAKVFQYLTQCSMFIYTVYMAFTRNWCVTHSGFISMMACSHFIKMHSYTEMNYLFREDYLQRNKNKQQDEKKPIVVNNYPNNISFSKFTLYMWMPVMVYEQEYPRFPEKRRWKYLIYKCFVTGSAILSGYIVISDMVAPAVEMGNKINSIELITRICLPLCAFHIIIFYIVFECILNVFAEITRFGDRSFYKDYWNSTTYEEFNRKWNQPVYNFLFRHVYLQCIYKYKKSKKFAQIVTFLFSACLHEYVFSLVFKTIFPINSLFMLQQIPLFYLTKHMQGQRSGSFLVWWGLILGVPLIGTFYLRLDTSLSYFQKIN